MPTGAMTEGLAPDNELRACLVANLAGFPVREIDDPSLRRAAVALAVTAGEDGSAAVLLTLRPAKMGRHAGQYALPGGRVDPGETAEGAALRELEEELGLSLSVDAVLGRLDDFPTRSGFRIAPFVVWAGPDVQLVPAPEEVSVVHRIPFVELDDDAAIPHFAEGTEPGRPVLFSLLPTLGHEMYAPTAAIMYQFREVAIRGHATRVAHYDQPRFAWK